MTLIVAWVGVDNKKNGKSIASLYFASDSKYSWGSGDSYDYGIKVFGSSKHPEIFCFCGDVLFPSIVLAQLMPQIDNGLLLSEGDTAEMKNRKIFDYIKTSFTHYPKNSLVGTFIILHGTRVGNEFKLYKISSNKKWKLAEENIDLPTESTKVFSGGSGGAEFDANWRYWDNVRHNNYRTSRAVYHCLEDTLKKIRDPSTGGMPQIVGLYRIGSSRLFGIIHDDKRFIYGKQASEDITVQNLEWRNENFERVNPETLKIFEGAQRQPL